MSHPLPNPLPFLTVAAARPSKAALAALLELQSAQLETFSGPLTPTPGFRYTQVLEPLGNGPDVFARAVQGLERWAVYPGWMTLYPHPAPVEKGVGVAFVTGAAPLWTVSAVRITAVERLERRFAFTLRTLPQHALTGTERFCVYLEEQGKVVYELTALSRPHHPLARLGGPVVRLVQRRFARDSVRSLRRFIRGGSGPVSR